MEGDVIQCPNCSKRYRLSGTPPPTFECRDCGTVMDLSAFAGAAPAAPPPPPAPAAPAEKAARGAAPASHGRPGRGRVRGGARAGRGRARGRHAGADDADGDGEGERGRYRGKKGPNMPLIIGSIGVAVVAVIVMVVYIGGQKPEQPKEKPKKAARVLTPDPVVQPDPEPVKKAEPKVMKGREDEKRPELSEGSFKDVPIPEGKRSYRYSSANLTVFDWPEYVTAEERKKIEEAIATFEWGGGDMRDAEEYLVGLDAYPIEGEKFRAVGRLISEFKNLYDAFDGKFLEPDCMSRLMVVDRVLRRIDGMQEREYTDRRVLNYQSTDREALTTMKRWTWWYDLEKWRLRREPWDESEDLEDPEAMGEDWEDEEDLEPMK